MAALITPIPILVTVAVLALAGLYGVWIAFVQHSIVSALIGTLALVASVAAALLKPWSRYLVYALATAAVAAWLYSMYSAAMVGYFSLYSSSQIVRQLAPGVLLVILSCYCAYAVYRHFGVPKSAGST